MHRHSKHTLKFATSLVIGIFGQQQQVEACVRRWQTLRGLAAVTLDNQLQLLQATYRGKVASSHEGKENLFLKGVERQEHLPKGFHVRGIFIESFVVSVPSELCEVQILLAADDHLKLSTVERVEER